MNEWSHLLLFSFNCTKLFCTFATEHKRKKSPHTQKKKTNERIEWKKNATKYLNLRFRYMVTILLNDKRILRCVINNPSAKTDCCFSTERCSRYLVACMQAVCLVPHTISVLHSSVVRCVLNDGAIVHMYFHFGGFSVRALYS